MRGKPSIADGGSERLVVALVLAGIGDGELGDRTIEDGACAEVANLRIRSAADGAHDASAVARHHPTDSHSVTAPVQCLIITSPIRRWETELLSAKVSE